MLMIWSWGRLLRHIAGEGRRGGQKSLHLPFDLSRAETTAARRCVASQCQAVMKSRHVPLQPILSAPTQMQPPYRFRLAAEAGSSSREECELLVGSSTHFSPMRLFCLCFFFFVAQA